MLEEVGVLGGVGAHRSVRAGHMMLARLVEIVSVGSCSYLAIWAQGGRNRGGEIIPGEISCRSLPLQHTF